MGRYYGKTCEKHPELRGARFESSYKCVGCRYDYSNQYRKSPDQLAKSRIRAKRSYDKSSHIESRVVRRRAKAKRWYDKNKAWFASRNVVVRAAKAVNPAHKDAMREFYAKRPKGKVVDHIIPFKGIDPKTRQHVICGLHVPWNLRYLPKLTNARKWAYFTPVTT